MSQVNGSSGESAVLLEILAGLKSIQQENSHLAAAIDAINGRVNILAGVKQMQDGITVDASAEKKAAEPEPPSSSGGNAAVTTPPNPEVLASPLADAGRRSSTTSKIILTSYPGQAGVDPLPMHWGHADPNVRGPVVVSRNQSTIRRRNGKLISHGQSTSAAPL